VDLGTLLGVAVGLSMDALAVAVASGACARTLHLGRALRMAALFGGFQALMPVIGWLAGWGFRAHIAAWDHWIAFGLLWAIGGKMIWEASGIPDDESARDVATERLLVLFGLAVATSIDALAVGLSFSFLGVDIPVPAAVIGAVTFVITLGGVWVGTRVGHFFERKIAVVGGVVLMVIGVKILVEHLAA
jgi:putative Mn2+ efflux pump MntP